MKKYVRLGGAIAYKVPGSGWRITESENLNDFNRLLDLLLEVEAKGAILEEIAQKYGATVEHVALVYEE